MKDSARHAVEGVRVLWPYLSPMEKLKWCEALREPLGVEDWYDVVPYVRDDSIDLVGQTSAHSEASNGP